MPEQPIANQETPSLADALQRIAHYYGQGQFEQAESFCRRVLAVKPGHFDALHILGAIKLKQQDYQEAVRFLKLAVSADPSSAEARSNLGFGLAELGRRKQALICYDQALAIDPSFAGALSNRGLVLEKLGRHVEAVQSYDKALSLKPDDAEVWRNRGISLERLGRYDEVIASYNRALAIRPDFAEALFHRGNAFATMNRNEEAIASYDSALAIKPDLAEALNNRGIALNQLGRHEDAVDSYSKALTVRFNYAAARFNRGIALENLKRFVEAVASYDSAVAIDPSFAAALNNRGNALVQLDLHREALASYDRAAAMAPSYAEPLYRRGLLLEKLHRHADAISSYARALAIRPDHPNAFGQMAHCELSVCNWKATKKLSEELAVRDKQGGSVIKPFTLLCYGAEPSQQLACARRYATTLSRQPVGHGKLPRAGKIRIAYLSANFYRHATSASITALSELHDRARFEVVGVSFGPYERSDMHASLPRSFDRFHDVRFESDRNAARLLNDLEIDIAVDLQGYTCEARPGILAYRPAPVQVNYLGYPTTMGAEFIDYVIADKIVLPFDQQPFYCENIVHIPDSYQSADSTPGNFSNSQTRGKASLPDHGIVFCCFNKSYKITAPAFDVWMRLLRAINGSVLWLFEANDLAIKNLRREAQARRVDPARLVFARPVSREDHLACYCLADLFLDTLPYNGRRTVTDALSVGLPVLTCKGNTFAGRMAPSLLHAVGLSELVTNNLEEYQALAFKLVRIPPLLKDFRRKLAENRLKYPLFDGDRYRRHIEAAYVKMWELWQRGDRPQSFSIEPM